MKFPFNYSYTTTKSGKFIGFAHEFPGAATQANTLEELEKRLMDAITCLLESNRLETDKILDGSVSIGKPLGAMHFTPKLVAMAM